MEIRLFVLRLTKVPAVDADDAFFCWCSAEARRRAGPLAAERGRWGKLHSPVVIHK